MRFIVSSLALTAAVVADNNGLAMKPPMGW